MYNTQEGVKGLVADPVKLVFNKLGIKYKFVALPTKRHMFYLKFKKHRFCSIGWYKNAERKKFAKFSLSIYKNKTRIAIARANNNKIQSGKTLDSILSDKNLSLLIKEGYSYGKYIDNKIKKIKPKIIYTTSESYYMIKMLHSKRADYFFLSEEEAESLISQAKLKKENFKYIKFKGMPSGLKRYILFPFKIKDSFIKKINKGIKKYIHKEK